MIHSLTNYNKFSAFFLNLRCSIISLQRPLPGILELFLIIILILDSTCLRSCVRATTIKNEKSYVVRIRHCKSYVRHSESYDDTVHRTYHIIIKSHVRHSNSYVRYSRGISRSYDISSRTYGTVTSRAYDTVSRTYDTVNRT